jgi:hypothetical protein
MGVQKGDSEKPDETMKPVLELVIHLEDEGWGRLVVVNNAKAWIRYVTRPNSQTQGESAHEAGLETIPLRCEDMRQEYVQTLAVEDMLVWSTAPPRPSLVVVVAWCALLAHQKERHRPTIRMLPPEE